MAHYYKDPNDMTLEYINSAKENKTPIVILKLETTGLDPVSDDICGIFALKVQFSKTDNMPIIVDQFKTLVKTYKPIPEDVSKINGITNEMIKLHGMNQSDAINRLN